MARCEICAGTGKISCGACWGGQSLPLCPDCVGRGEVRNGPELVVCGRCQGMGHVSPQSCPSCGNSSVCRVCCGTGEV